MNDFIVLFAVMNDRRSGSVLNSLRKQISNENVFSYGITDTIRKNDEDFGIFLYKPNAKRGIRVAARGIKNNLPEPFGTVVTQFIINLSSSISKGKILWFIAEVLI